MGTKDKDPRVFPSMYSLSFTYFHFKYLFIFIQRKKGNLGLIFTACKIDWMGANHSEAAKEGWREILMS